MHLSKFPTVLSEVLLDSLNALSSLDHLHYITDVFSSSTHLNWHRACLPNLLDHCLLPTHFLQLTYKLLCSSLNLVECLDLLNFYCFWWTVKESRVFHVGKGTEGRFGQILH